MGGLDRRTQTALRCRLRERAGLSLIELMVVFAIVALIASIVIGNLLRGRTTSNEAAAIGNLRTVAVTVHMFSTLNNRYPADWLTDMYTDADPDYGPPSFDVSMENSLIQGYRYTYARRPPGCTTACAGYTITAVPEQLGTGGTRAFYVDDAGKIRHCTGAGPADATDAPVTEPPRAC